MITVDEAFEKFSHRQELTEREQADVSRRHLEVRAAVCKGVNVERDVLTGSYDRWTKTRPLQDVDVFCILGEDERDYRDQHPSAILRRVEDVLTSSYARDRVTVDRMAVRVDFGITVSADDDSDDKVLSIEVVPAFTKGDHFEIPDELLGRWIETDPQAHADLAVAAHEAYQRKWKPLVRMIKKWNRVAGCPVLPSFLLEVMALDLLVPPFSGGFPYELKAFFAAGADRICDPWPDPAGLGPDVNSQMAQAQMGEAARALQRAEARASEALLQARQGKHGDALRTWRALFGPHFPLS